MTSRHATVVAYLALFVALSGSAVAVTSIGSKEIRDNSVASRDIRNNTVSSKDIRDRSVAFRDLRKSTIDALKTAGGALGAVGPTGAQGAAGPQGPAGPASVPARTVLVGAGGTPVENGNALRSALAGLPAATAEEPRAVQLGAGQYDANGQAIAVPSDVTLQGAGQAATVILSSPANIKNSVVTLDDRAVLRDVAVRSASVALGSAAVDGAAGLDSIIERVNLSGGTGVILKGGIIRDADILVTGPAGSGIRLLSGGTVQPRISGSRILVLSDGGLGINASQNFHVRGSTISVIGSNQGETGVRLNTVPNGTSFIDDSEISAVGGGPNDAVHITTSNTTPGIEISHSRIDAGGNGVSTALKADGGDIDVAVSQVRGTTNLALQTNGGGATCFQTYDINYAATGAC